MNTTKSDDMVQVKATLRVHGQPDKPTIASMPRRAVPKGATIVEAANV